MSASASVRESGTRAYGYEMETPQAIGPVAPELEDVVARLIARASGTAEPDGAPQLAIAKFQLHGGSRNSYCTGNRQT